LGTSKFKIEDISICSYKSARELEWLDVHASVMVDSNAWWTVLHKKPIYEKPTVDLIVLHETKIIGFIVIEINSDINPENHPSGFVWEFGVHRDYRGLRIGYKLIDEAHKIMNMKYNVNKTIWYSQDEFAQKYYQKLGMKEIGRHWQFTAYADNELKKLLKSKGFDCWNLRGSCSVKDWDTVRKNFKIEFEDNTLKPRICVGYEFIK
jgi:ribosomal protein S18 acetylase RimI-like enzyme